MSVFRSAIVIGILTFLSRVLGYARDVFIAKLLGAGMLADVFLVAFRLPNFFRRLFAEGAFSSAFVPLFAGTLASEGESAARQFADKVFTILLLVLLVFTVAMQIAMPWLMVVLAPGFTDSKEKFDLAVYLSRITMPYLLFISLVSLLSGVLNSVGRFAAAAASPILLNLCMVSAIGYFSRYAETPAHALAWGVAAAGVIQFIALVISCSRAGFMVRLTVPRMDGEVKKLLKNMVPGVIGGGISQINLLVDTIIATLLPHGAVSLLYYADRINQLPLALIGTAIGTVLLPLLSRQIREGNKDAALATQNRALEVALLLSLPAFSALLMIAHPLIIVLFERGAFSANESYGAAIALIAFAFGLPAFILIKIFAPCFFAVQDTKTPVRVAILCLFTNIVLNLLVVALVKLRPVIDTPFVTEWLTSVSLYAPLNHFASSLEAIPLIRWFTPYSHVGIALATSLSAWLNAFLLWRLLVKRRLFELDNQLKRRFPRIVFSCAVMITVLWGMNHLIGGFFRNPNLLLQVGAFGCLIGAGFIAYALTAYFSGALDMTEIRMALRKKPKGSA